LRSSATAWVGALSIEAQSLIPSFRVANRIIHSNADGWQGISSVLSKYFELLYGLQRIRLGVPK
jgi:hypothetical protein